jgi:hypothetical protein
MNRPQETETEGGCPTPHLESEQVLLALFDSLVLGVWYFVFAQGSVRPSWLVRVLLSAACQLRLSQFPVCVLLSLPHLLRLSTPVRVPLFVWHLTRRLR